jgi:carboxyl-terminal processing protease
MGAMTALRPLFLACALVACCASGLPAQQPERLDPEYGRIMLGTIRRHLRAHYYDTAFHHVNIDSVFKAAEERLSSAQTNTQLFAIIATAVFTLDDSHTSFWPPERTAEVRYGWQLGMVGDSCYITAVANGSDAERQGVHVGDRVLAVDRYAVTRANYWKMTYVLGELDPRAAVTLILEPPGGEPREVRIASKVIPHKPLVNLTWTDGGLDIWDLVREEENWDRRHRDEFVTVDSILIWRLPTFVVARDRIDAGMARARHHRALILDLRGNSGGYEFALLRMLGSMFATDVRVGTVQKRSGSDSLVAETHGSTFTAPLVVLVDSRSASASEMLAGTVQMEKRGVVLGDRSAGAVMASLCYGLSAGSVLARLYALCVTVTDLVLRDGTRLEKRGVMPDEVVLPSGADLAAGRDPALARALERLGHHADPTQAGRLMPRPAIELLW